jgi:hypothetical protein
MNGPVNHVKIQGCHNASRLARRTQSGKAFVRKAIMPAGR